MARTSLYPPSVDPGFPELPPTPAGWTLTTFGTVLDVVERPLKLDPDATYRLVTAKRNRGGITLRSEMLGREILTKTQFEAKEHDFLISRRQIIHGACGVVPAGLDGAVVSNEYSTLRTRPTLLMEYLSQYSHSPYFQRTCFHSSHGVDVEKMIFKIDEWLAREVAIPSLGEQRKIAAILSSVDDAIEATQAVIDQLQVVTRAMITELLTRGLPGRHTRFKQTEIGEVPEEWDVVRLDSVAATCSGGTPPRDDSSNYGGGVPWVKSGEVDNPWIENTEESISAHGLETSAARWVEAGSVLVAMYGATAGKVGRLGIRATTNQAVCAIKASASAVTDEFIYWCLLMSTPALLRSVQGSGQPNLNAGIIRALAVPVPPRNEQEIICRVLGGLVARLSAEREGLAAVVAIKAALTSVLLTGEVRVTPDEASA